MGTTLRLDGFDEVIDLESFPFTARSCEQSMRKLIKRFFSKTNAFLKRVRCVVSQQTLEKETTKEENKLWNVIMTSEEALYQLLF